MEVWQTTSLDEAVAEEFFGWRWRAYIGKPIRGTPGYYGPDKMHVRQFMSPETMADPDWQDHFARKEGRPADGSEPLAYCYCSSCGPEMVPHFEGHAEAVAMLEKELRRRKLWDKYREQLWMQVGRGAAKINEAKLAAAKPKDRCIAALAVVGSRFVKPVACPARFGTAVIEIGED